MFASFSLAPVLRRAVLTPPSTRVHSCLRGTTRRYLASPTPASSWTNLMKSYFVDSARPSQTLDQKWAERSKKALDSLARSPPANPYSGRSVPVSNGNVADAFRQLDGILGRNKVRAQLRLAERHEKKGAKRRRLSSQRWRRQFANEVRKKVQLVAKIRNRGA
ncbi:hypothetical protein BDN72DRAFT_831037 [Pluteus cervinus]|uniref:Uncharacterized protein n=1 Tax=Pluteus cervinus TaxID=181527 RepID=A0ACD3BFM2_9AGAR|nr:hypothetical protein BDN72DRAFT_831037 [Pluteus cervinus]